MAQNLRILQPNPKARAKTGDKRAHVPVRFVIAGTADNPSAPLTFTLRQHQGAPEDMSGKLLGQVHRSGNQWVAAFNYKGIPLNNPCKLTVQAGGQSDSVEGIVIDLETDKKPFRPTGAIPHPVPARGENTGPTLDYPQDPNVSYCPDTFVAYGNHGVNGVSPVLTDAAATDRVPDLPFDDGTFWVALWFGLQGPSATVAAKDPIDDTQSLSLTVPLDPNAC